MGFDSEQQKTTRLFVQGKYHINPYQSSRKYVDGHASDSAALLVGILLQISNEPSRKVANGAQSRCSLEKLLEYEQFVSICCLPHRSTDMFDTCFVKQVTQ